MVLYASSAGLGSFLGLAISVVKITTLLAGKLRK